MSLQEKLCTPPSIPSPPPFPEILTPLKFTKTTEKITETSFLSDEEELTLAYNRIKFHKDFSCEIFYSHYINLKPQLQVGPTCGLVALSIASTIAQNFISVNNIFETALSLGYTKQGEIFSAEFLADLAEKCGNFKAKIIKGNLKSHLHCIIINLLKKNLVLIPYDADHNHSPCCKKGYKAHWTVISGFAIFSASIQCSGKDDHIDDANDTVKLDSGFCSLCNCEQNETFLNNYSFKFINKNGNIFITKKTTLNEAIFIKAKESRIYLIGRQGKSKHIGLWLFDKMAESNDNLLFFSRNQESEKYILPQGGLAEGLRNKAIILTPNLDVNKNF